MTNLDMRNMNDHYPQRDNQVAAWIKDRRDQYPKDHSLAPSAWDALDNLLDEYRLAADTGQSLENIVNEEIYEEEKLNRRLADQPKRKKKPRP